MKSSQGPVSIIRFGKFPELVEVGAGRRKPEVKAPQTVQNLGFKACCQDAKRKKAHGMASNHKLMLLLYIPLRGTVRAQRSAK